MAKRERHPKYEGVYTYAGKNDITTFYIRYNIGRKVVTEKVGKSSEGYTAKKASVIRGERIHTIRHGEELPDRKSGVITLNTIWPKYLADLEFRGKKQEAQRYTYEAVFRKTLGDIPLKMLTADHVRRMERHWIKKFQPVTINTYIARLKAIIHFAIREGLYKGAHPLAAVRYIAVDGKRTRFLSHEEATALLEELDAVDEGLALQARIALLTGARKGEVFQISAKRINWETLTCWVPKAKQKTDGRHLYIGGVADDLRRYIDAHRIKGRLFTGVFKEHLFRKTVEALGLNDNAQLQKDRVVFHTLRHTCASWLVQDGVDILTVSKVLGHSDLKHTLIYAHLAPDQTKDAVLKLRYQLRRAENPQIKVVNDVS